MDIAGSPTITENDIESLNQRTLLRSTMLLRRGAEVALAVALLLVIAWLWGVVRFQQLITDSLNGGNFAGIGAVGFTDIPWTQRVDGFAQSLSGLGFAAIVAGVGLALRMYGEVTAVRLGGQLTLWQVGDHIDEDEDENLDA